MDATPEEWRPVVGYEGLYEVSDQGRVRSLDRTVVTSNGPRSYKGKLLKPRPSLGYHLVCLTAPGRCRRTAKVHHLVLEAFCGPRPDGMSGCHNNGIKTDNRSQNLRWDTHTENMRDVVRHGRHHLANRDRCSKGHLFSESNTRLRNGRRVCLTCQKQYNDGYYRAACDEKRSNGWTPKSERTQCPRGHDYDYLHVNRTTGKVTRHCKTCRAENNRNFIRRKAGLQ